MITFLLIQTIILSMEIIIAAIDHHQYNNNNHHHQLENDYNNDYNDKYNFNYTYLQNNWLSEINQSITRNIMFCSYQKVKFFDIYNNHNTNTLKKVTSSSVASSDSQFYLTYHIPSIHNKEVIRFQHLSSTITRAHNYLYNAGIMSIHHHHYNHQYHQYHHHHHHLT